MTRAHACTLALLLVAACEAEPPTDAARASGSAPRPGGTASGSAATSDAGVAPRDAAAPGHAALPKYVPTVTTANRTTIPPGTKANWAIYLKTMHDRIHPKFGEGYVAGLEKRQVDDELSNPKLWTTLELVIDGETGNLDKVGVIRESGVAAFDEGAVAAVRAASPFGKATKSIRSPNDKVYVWWELRRDPYHACTEKFAQPFILKGGRKKE